MLNYTIRNTNVGLDLAVFLDEEIAKLLLLRKEHKEDIDKMIPMKLNPNTIKWAMEDETLKNEVEVVSEDLGVTVEEFIETMLWVMMLEEKQAAVIMCQEYSNKEEFLTRLMAYFEMFKSEHSKMKIAPDILAVIYCFIKHEQSDNNVVEVSERILPYILNVESAMPENPPEGFEFSQEEKEILNKFGENF